MNVEIAERLAARRKEAGLSQEALAEKLGVSRQAVSKWERSESSPDTDNLIALAELYGVPLDDLLYVDDAIKEDVHFEAEDKATQYRKKEEPHSDNKSHSGDEDSSKEDYVHIGPQGIHVEDGKDSVHISWKEGIHVNSGKSGDEVHVGWDGIRVNDDAARNAEKDEAKVSWGSCEGKDGISWDKDGIWINGEHSDNWGQVKEKYGHGHFHYYAEQKNPFLKFPFPLVAIIAYLLIGFMLGQWAVGLFVFFTIPLYYLLATAITKKEIAPFLSATYPIGCVAWFLWMAFVESAPHPAWIIFLTIPIAEWLIISVSRSWRRKKKKKQAPIDVEPE